MVLDKDVFFQRTRFLRTNERDSYPSRYNGYRSLQDGSKLNCLLYADDLILISNTTEGLQRSLDIFNIQVL